MRSSAEALLGFVFLGFIPSLAEACALNGPRYGLASDTVRWSLELTSGESCTRGVRLNNVVDRLTVVSASQTGQVAVVGPGFSYKAASDFQGRDRFSLMVAGTINKVPGSSTIEVIVYVSRVSEPRRPPHMIAPSNDTDPSPPAPTGLSSDGHGGTVVVDPRLGSVFPNATNTGVSAGTALKPSGGLVLSTPGQVINGLDISGGVDIHASNVTLENCIIRVSDPNANWVVSVLGGLTGVVIKNCEIIGPGLPATTQTSGIYVIGNSQVTINSSNIHEVGHGIDVSGGPVTIQNSYIHDLNANASSHYDGIYYGGGSGPNFSLNIQNNTIINSHDQTSAIFTENYFGPVSNVTVNNNLLVGGGYTVYLVSNTQSNGGGGQGGALSNISYTNNHLGTGNWGYTAFEGPYNPVYTGNVNDGAALAAALPVSPVISAASAAAGTYGTGNTLTLTLYTSEAVKVSGTPTLTLNDGGTATYTGSSVSNALTFSYTVASGQNTSALAVTSVNGTIKDYDGHALSASNLSATFAGVVIGSPATPPVTLER